MTATADSTLVIPEALATEYGEFWMEGHVDPALAVLAVVREQMINVGADEAADLLLGHSVRPRAVELFEVAAGELAPMIEAGRTPLEIAERLWQVGLLGHASNVRPYTPDEFDTQGSALLASIRHIWTRIDPDNDEQMVICEQHDPSAQPWTRVTP